ncbi:MAG: agmatine deiminase family protein [Prevotella sp.]|nr:agmatine deiminase family protein [Prevotella sp.]
MSLESIIGIIASLVTIATAIGIKFDLIDIDVFNKRPVKELFEQLIDKKTTDAKRKKILHKLNKYDIFNHKIKNEYIQTFSLGKRGGEDVLYDICDSNDIVPTDDICKGVLGYSRSSILTKYQEKRRNIEEPTSPTITPVIPNEPKEKKNIFSGKQTVYLSGLLKTKYPETCNKLIKILEKHDVKYAFVEGTKDIWCRDYMPVQTPSGKLVQFTYDPSYLRGNKKWEDSRSDVKEICRLNNINAQFSDINLDGGNVLICEGRAIISDRIFSENANMNREELVNELGKLLECEIIIIPAEKDDMTGHADGMVRFVNKNTIIGNNLEAEYKYWREGMQKMIEKYNLKYINMPFFVPKDSKHPLSAVGIYVNYLEVNNLIVLPVFGREEDKQAITIIKEVFPNKAIETIDYNDVAYEGGLLNCTTWVITH